MMNVDEVVETVAGFLKRLTETNPGMAAEMRRIEIDLDEDGVVKIGTDVGAGWAALG
jgi:hypothetical protein